ncbi:MAG TPA: hypothetical protein VMR88_04220, partial [Candidatus Polarisedimenticolaceae bacterium]|nr:hypothetical protein [Candidatus Polarisedimenticolaceae bacterium]
NHDALGWRSNFFLTSLLSFLGHRVQTAALDFVNHARSGPAWTTAAHTVDARASIVALTVGPVEKISLPSTGL